MHPTLLFYCFNVFNPQQNLESYKMKNFSNTSLQYINKIYDILYIAQTQIKAMVITLTNRRISPVSHVMTSYQ